MEKGSEAYRGSPPCCSYYKNNTILLQILNNTAKAILQTTCTKREKYIKNIQNYDHRIHLLSLITQI